MLWVKHDRKREKLCITVDRIAAPVECDRVATGILAVKRKGAGEVIGVSFRNADKISFDGDSVINDADKTCLRSLRAVLGMLYRNAPPAVKEMCRGYDGLQEWLGEISR